LNRINLLAIFGIVFLSSILLGNGIYSNQLFALENQTGTENEAEIEADIEQENKCKKDTECENENEINNSLTIVNNATQSQQQEEQPEASCEECVTSILTEEQIQTVLNSDAFPEDIPLNSVDDLCILIANEFDNPEFVEDFNIALLQADLTEEQFDELEQCLADLGYPMDLHPVT